MLIHKNLGGGKDRCLVKEDSKSLIRNHQELVLLDLEGFLNPNQANALKREKANLADQIRELRGYNDNGKRNLASLGPIVTVVR